MSGVGNTFKRRQSSFVPELSEYDLWDKREARGLSYTRVAGAWKPIQPLLAVVQQTEFKNAWEYISAQSVKPGYVKTLFFTPPGAGLAEKGGARVAAERRVDNGLLARESIDGKTVAGMYWERTAQVTTHHPADCLHSMVDLGPTTAAKPLVVRGKVYWFKGTKDDLLARWKRDFAS
jgi:hypothetical protein